MHLQTARDFKHTTEIILFYNIFAHLQDPEGENKEKRSSRKAHIQGASESLFTCAQCMKEESTCTETRRRNPAPESL